MSERASALESDLRDLMLRGLDGDQQAHAELLSRLARLLARYFEARMRASPDEVEDLVQDTLLAVHEKRHTYDRSRWLTPWVFGIARHKLLSRLRRLGRREALPLEAADDVADPVNHEEGAVRMDLARLIGWLSPRQRRVLEDVKISGHSVAEAAERERTTSGAIKVSIHRSLKALAAKVRHED